MASVFFKRTQELELKITDFLDNIVSAGQVFLSAIGQYCAGGATAEFTINRQSVSLLESKNDSIRREVEKQMYSQMILPDMRSDILRILEGCDTLINRYESNLIDISVENPKLPDSLKEGIIEMASTTVQTVERLILAVRDFFNGKGVSEYVSNVFLLENQVDKQALLLKQRIFLDKKLTLAAQLQLKVFVYGIEKISDKAEDVADNITIMAVKHSI